VLGPLDGDFALRLSIDLVAIAILAFGLSLPRRGRRDLVVLHVVLNVALLVALTVIAAGEVGAAVGFGLFAVLAILRLRSEELDLADVAYVFAALILGLVCGIDLGEPGATAILAALVLAAVVVADHPRLLPAERRVEVVLDRVVSDERLLAAELGPRFGGTVAAVKLVEVDDVRETTRVKLRLRPEAR
jgi:hypothetical protein